ncbi:MAG TPA: hypothetical protein VGF77_13325 [Allosphingosinicella sp.]|jgi:hypothetical protein
MQHFTTAPAAAAPGLDLFAGAWLERLLALGGGMMVFPDGSGRLMWRPSASDAPGYQPPPEDEPDDVAIRRSKVENMMFAGRNRELQDLLDLVPGGKEAVKAHVRTFPSYTLPDGSVGLM